MEKTLQELIAEMDKIEALSEQLTSRDKSMITRLYNQYKDGIQPNLKGLAARVYDAAINDKEISSRDANLAKQVYNQVMPQVPNVIKTTYGGMISRALDQLEKSTSAEPAQQAAQSQAEPAAQAQAEPAAQSGGAVSGGTLRRGAKGQAVVDLQNKLGIEADGEYGPATASAVEKFQQENGLEADGVVGPTTLAALNSEPAAEPAQGDEPAAEPATAGTPTARLDTKGETPPAATDEPDTPDEPDQPTRAGSNDFDTAQQVGGTVYQNDAEAIEGLMAKNARTPEEESYLTMLARKHNFYGKPENIGAAIQNIRSSISESKDLYRIIDLAGL